MLNEQGPPKLTGGEIWEFLFSDMKGDVPARLTDDVLERLALHIRAHFGGAASPQPIQGVTVKGGPEVEWVVNDNAELGVKIGKQFFFLYKGTSLTYSDGRDGIALHDDGTPMHWRHVFKREFGECAHPINRHDPARIGTVSLDDSDEWQELPAADQVNAPLRSKPSAPSKPSRPPMRDRRSLVVQRIGFAIALGVLCVYGLGWWVGRWMGVW